jgi:hypothetical protein
MAWVVLRVVLLAALHGSGQAAAMQLSSAVPAPLGSQGVTAASAALPAAHLMVVTTAMLWGLSLLGSVFRSISNLRLVWNMQQ